MQRTLITGIGGFAGRHLADYLRPRADVELLGLGTAAATDVPCARYFCCDLTDVRAVQHTIDEARPDAVYHLAARTGGTTPERMHDVNVRGFMNLCDALRRNVERRGAAGVSRPVRMVVVGSAAELGATGTARLPVSEEAPCEPETVYGRTKLEVTQRALREPAHGPLRISVARTFNLVGPGLGANLSLGRFVEQIAQFARGEIETLRCGNLAARRDFVDIRDAVQAYVAIAERGLPGELYHVCRGESHEIGALLRHLIVASGLPVPIESDPTPRPGDLADVYGDPTKTERATGWKAATSIEMSLEEMLDAALRSRKSEVGSRNAEMCTPLRSFRVPNSEFRV
jgi:nucleoside-diphosphate-sugar epimerase